MSGHSKWSTIKHKKALLDNRRGQVFTKLAKAIAVASKEGGGPDIETNFQLRLMVDKAKQMNMPKDSIQRAIERGSGQGGGEGYMEMVYEGYGPEKIAVMVEVVTDNKNRTAAEIKSTFDKNGGTIGQTGTVNFLFDKKGRLLVEVKGDKEKMMLNLIDVGAEDVEAGEDGIEVLVGPAELFKMKQAIEKMDFKVIEAEQIYVPKNRMSLDEDKKQKVIRFLEVIEEMDDVQSVYTNVLL